jgi:hypothetical protein
MEREREGVENTGKSKWEKMRLRVFLHMFANEA